MLNSPAFWPTGIVVAIATVSDLGTRRIPNWLVIPFFAAGLIVSGVVGAWHGLLQSVLGIGVAAVLMTPLHLLGSMGAGDVKLCIAIGAWVGPRQIALALLMTAIAGAFMAAGWAISGRFFSEALHSTARLLQGTGPRVCRVNKQPGSESSSGRWLPYAPAIAFGSMFSFFMGGM